MTGTVILQKPLTHYFFTSRGVDVAGAGASQVLDFCLSGAAQALLCGCGSHCSAVAARRAKTD